MNPYGLPQTNLGDDPLNPQPPNYAQMVSIPTQVSKGGMFGGMGNPGMAISAALNGYLYGSTGGRMGSEGLQMLGQQRMFDQQQKMAILRDNLEFQRQMQIAQQAAQLKLLYPDGDKAQIAFQSGLRPGTPGWDAYWQKQADLSQNPVVNAGPYGPVLYNQVAGVANAKPLTDDDIAKMSGGQTAPAPSGTFPY